MWNNRLNKKLQIIITYIYIFNNLICIRKSTLSVISHCEKSLELSTSPPSASKRRYSTDYETYATLNSTTKANTQTQLTLPYWQRRCEGCILKANGMKMQKVMCFKSKQTAAIKCTHKILIFYSTYTGFKHLSCMTMPVTTLRWTLEREQLYGVSHATRTSTNNGVWERFPHGEVKG